MEISTALAAKAQRLVEEGRVFQLKGVVYTVEGDNGFYNVLLSYPQEVTGTCNCPSKAAVCSHLLAASISYLADPPPVSVSATDPFEGII